jgi:hypothetical protein
MNGLMVDSSIMAYSNRDTVMLDLDDVDLEKAKAICDDLLDTYSLGNYCIAESSPGSHHAVFDRRVDWCEKLSYVAHVLLKNDLPKLNAWLLNHIRKGYMDLRVTPKGGKTTPKIVYRKGSKGNRIQHCENHRAWIEDLIMKKNG